MKSLYDLDFDLDAFLETMAANDQPAWRKVEDYMEERRLRNELCTLEDDLKQLDPR